MNEIKNNFLQEMAISSEKRLEESRIHLSEESLLGACEDLEERSAIEFQEGFIFITEIKKSSPSLGEISNREFDITDQAGIYVKSGTNVISVLTEPLRFSGSLQDLKHVSKAFPETPTMRKDFLVDPYQVSEAFINGARGILLIVAMLSDDMLNQMVERAIKHQMFVLLEVFDEKLPELMSLLKDDDIMIITADHGCDPTWPGSDHTREHVPVLVYGHTVGAIALGRRTSFADIGQSLATFFELAPMEYGTNFVS